MFGVASCELLYCWVNAVSLGFEIPLDVEPPLESLPPPLDVELIVTLIVLLAGCAVLENPDTGELVPYNPIYVVFVYILLIATLFITIYSGYDYIVKNIGNLKDDSVKKKNKSHK